MNEAITAFLIGFPALFSIVNPISGAFIFRAVTAHRPRAAQARLARLVGINSCLVMVFALWAGSLVLSFFGITLAALRVAGGLVVAVSAWTLLNNPEVREERKQEQAAPSELSDDVAMFPLTIPFTTGPGTIAVAVALGAAHHSDLKLQVWHMAGTTVAALSMAMVIWLTYHSAEWISRWMGPTGSRTVTRLSGFLLLCIGVQILITGVEGVLGPLLARR